MKTDDLRTLLVGGQTEKVLEGLLQQHRSLGTAGSVDIHLLAARYRAMKRDDLAGRLTTESKRVELVAIHESLLRLITQLEGGPTLEDNELNRIQSLGKKFLDSSDITSTTARLREKNQLIRDICMALIDAPQLADQLCIDSNEGILAGLAMKMRVVPDINDLSKLEKMTATAKKNFTKGVIANTLAQLVYSGQLRLGDDQIIRQLLSQLSQDADVPLAKNVERIEAALDYLVQ